MEFFNDYMVPAVVGICLCVGFVVKKWIADVRNQFIPTIVAVLGVIISVWINGWQITPPVILSGMISGLASTGLHQVFKQYLENPKNE